MDKLIRYNQDDQRSDMTTHMTHIKHVVELQNSRDIYYGGRSVRPDLKIPDKKKVSHRYYVDNCHITPENLKILIKHKGLTENNPFDLSVYTNNGLFPIYSEYKKLDGKTFLVPQLKPIDKTTLEEVQNPDITKYCPSYIEESFVDLDKKFAHIFKADKKEEKQDKVEFIVDDDNDDNKMDVEEHYKKLDLEELITYQSQTSSSQK
jgi:hypothetical protein